MLQTKEKDYAIALFSLAQLLMIFSGFLFAAGGIFFTNSINMKVGGISTVNSLILQHQQVWATLGKDIPAGEFDFVNQLGRDYFDKESVNLKKGFYIYSCLGVFFFILSIVIWYIGYKRLKSS